MSKDLVHGPSIRRTLRDCVETRDEGKIERRVFDDPINGHWDVVSTGGFLLFRVLRVALMLERITTGDGQVYAAAKADWAIQPFRQSVTPTKLWVDFYLVDYQSPNSPQPVLSCRVADDAMFRPDPDSVLGYGAWTEIKPRDYDLIAFYDYGITNGSFQI